VIIVAIVKIKGWRITLRGNRDIGRPLVGDERVNREDELAL
jgi:hypothetical protein